MGISYNQMKYFVTVAETLNITTASKQLYMTQPALGRQITALEKELNMQLLLRTTHGLALTPAGKYLQDQWTDILTRIDYSIDQATRISAGFDGNLKIGILSEADATKLIGDKLMEFESRYPNVKITLKRYSFRDLREKLQQKELDAIISYEHDLYRESGICYEKLIKMQPAMAIPSRNPLYHKPEITFADFADQEIIIMTDQDVAVPEQVIIDDCKRYGNFYPKLYYTSSISEGVLALETGSRCAIMNMELNIASTDKVRMFPLEHADSEYYVFAWNEKSDNACIPVLRDVIIT